MSEAKEITANPRNYIENKVTLENKVIEYKKIEANRLNNDGYNAVEIPFNFTEQYIDKTSVSKLLPNSDTSVINIGVGNGKTTVAYGLIEDYVSKGYVVIVASPYISLTYKDLKNISEKLPNVPITHYSDIEIEPLSKLLSSKIHIITINSLLLNPSEKFSNPNPLKVQYIKSLAEHCRVNNLNVVMFFDEIHAGVKNFQKQFIPNLNIWNGIVDKIFILSATFTEASYPVIKHLANLTQKKISIINCERRKHITRSDLHIILTPSRYHGTNLIPLLLLSDIINQSKTKTINILTGTRSFAEGLINDQNDILSSVSEKLDFNLCISGGNRYDSNKVNIGTTFTSGENIEATDSVYIIICPPYFGPKNRNNIFADGQPSIIQAMARPRNGGHIYVFMPSPIWLIEGDYINKNSLKEYVKSYHIPYKSLHAQADIIDKEYDKYVEVIQSVIKTTGKQAYIESKEEFIIMESQKELASNYCSYGKEIGSYITWAGFNNQFTNCDLKSIIKLNVEYIPKIIPTDGSKNTIVRDLLSNTIQEEIKELNDNDALEYLYDDIYRVKGLGEGEISFKMNEIIYNEKKISRSELKRNIPLNKTLIGILSELRGSKGDYTVNDYILDNIFYSRTASAELILSLNLYIVYAGLDKIRERLIERTKTNKYIDEDFITDDEVVEIEALIQVMLNEDRLIKQEIFSFLQNFILNKKGNKKRIVLMIRKLFFEVEPSRKTKEGKRIATTTFKSVVPFPMKLNFNFPIV